MVIHPQRVCGQSVNSRLGKNTTRFPGVHTYISANELGEVCGPDVAEVWPLKECHTSFICPEGLLEIFVFF